MADRITVDIDCYMEVARKLRRVERELESAGSQLQHMNLSRSSGAYARTQNAFMSLYSTGAILGGSDVRTSLNHLARATNGLASFAGGMSGKVNQAASLFEDVERRITDSAEIGETALEGAGSGTNGGWGPGTAYTFPQWAIESIAGLFNITTQPSSWTSAVYDKVMDFLHDATILEEDGMGIIKGKDKTILALGGKLIASYGEELGFLSSTRTLTLKEDKTELELKGYRNLTDFKSKKKILDMIPDDKKTTRYYDKDGNRIEKEPNGAKVKEGSRIIGYGTGAGMEGALYKDSISYTNGKFTTDCTVAAGTVSGELTCEGGLWGYTITEKNADGQEVTRRVFSPGFKAKIGASACALETNISMNYELMDNVSVDLSSETKVLNAYGEGDMKIGWVDGELSGAISGKVGVDLVSTTLKGDIDVMGLKGTGSVTAKVGLGIEGSIGYDKGVFKISGGAAIGVGVSANFEIDVSGLVDTVASVAKDAEKMWNNVTQGASNIAEGAFKLLTGGPPFWA